VFFFPNAFSQTKTKYKGYFCTGVNKNSPFTYTREYKKDSGNFVTLYKISTAQNGYYLDITATHYKAEKKVVVVIDDVYTKGTPFYSGPVRTQEIYYDAPALKLFGTQGIVKQSMDGQNALPNELALKFTNNKYDYVKVASIAKGVDNLYALKWYVLDEKN